jgi:hypothetical protein
MALIIYKVLHEINVDYALFHKSQISEYIFKTDIFVIRWKLIIYLMLY